VLHLAPSGESSFLPGGRSTPLGTLGPGVAVPQASITLEPGASVLLYTDGLVERRDDGLASRLEQLRAAMAVAPTDLDACLGHLTAVLLGDGIRVDDVALLALRMAGGRSASE
jgi:serine phosphatase RsbU (regulator of sigma subunit)